MSTYLKRVLWCRCWWKSSRSLWMCCRSVAVSSVKIIRLRLILSRRRRRRSSSLDMVLVVTWPGEYFFIHCKDQLHHSGRKETLQAVHRALPRLCIQVCLDIHATPKSVAEVGVMMMLLMMNTGDDFKTF